jgi:RNA polymerase sigma-B factor
VERHLGLARAIAGRYRRPGAGFDDIAQVAALALVEAVNRFDCARGVAFSAFAVPTVLGAVKRHFRDTRWVLQTPRRLKELHLEIRSATDALAQRLGHAPTVADLADHLGQTEADIVDALHAADALHPLSIDAPLAAADGDGATLASTLAAADDPYLHVEAAETLRPLLAQLPERELRVVTLRFFGNLTQSQIAERIGCSQMHISRILRDALDRLRRGLEGCRTDAGGSAVVDANSRAGGADSTSRPRRHQAQTGRDVCVAGRAAADPPCAPSRPAANSSGRRTRCANPAGRDPATPACRRLLTPSPSHPRMRPSCVKGHSSTGTGPRRCTTRHGRPSSTTAWICRQPSRSGIRDRRERPPPATDKPGRQPGSRPDRRPAACIASWRHDGPAAVPGSACTPGMVRREPDSRPDHRGYIGRPCDQAEGR